MKILKILLGAVEAGICIGIGGAVFLALDNKIAGALFFTLGLFAICTRGLLLFTGKVGYALENGRAFLAKLALIWFGNLVGTNLVAYALRMTRLCTVFAAKAEALCAVKSNDSLWGLFLLGVFCNILMFVAVDGFQNNPHAVGKYLGLFLGVSVFILAGFEHCVADMFYFGMAGAWSADTVLRLVVITAGNIVGGLLFPLMERRPKEPEQQPEILR